MSILSCPWSRPCRRADTCHDCSGSVLIKVALVSCPVRAVQSTCSRTCIERRRRAAKLQLDARANVTTLLQAFGMAESACMEQYPEPSESICVEAGRSAGLQSRWSNTVAQVDEDGGAAGKPKLVYKKQAKKQHALALMTLANGMAEPEVGDRDVREPHEHSRGQPTDKTSSAEAEAIDRNSQGVTLHLPRLHLEVCKPLRTIAATAGADSRVLPKAAQQRAACCLCRA